MSVKENVHTAIVDELEGLTTRTKYRGEWVEGVVEIVECGREEPEKGERVCLWGEQNTNEILTIEQIVPDSEEPYITANGRKLPREKFMEYRFEGRHKVLNVDDFALLWSDEIYQEKYWQQDWDEGYQLGDLFG